MIKDLLIGYFALKSAFLSFYYQSLASLFLFLFEQAPMMLFQVFLKYYFLLVTLILEAVTITKDLVNCLINFFILIHFAIVKFENFFVLINFTILHSAFLIQCFLAYFFHILSLLIWLQECLFFVNLKFIFLVLLFDCLIQSFHFVYFQYLATFKSKLMLLFKKLVYLIFLQAPSDLLQAAYSFISILKFQYFIFKN